MIENMGQCQYPGGCFDKARYPLYYTDPQTGVKEWIWVCDFHEKVIARENLTRAGVFAKKNGHGRYQYKKLKKKNKRR